MQRGRAEALKKAALSNRTHPRRPSATPGLLIPGELRREPKRPFDLPPIITAVLFSHYSIDTRVNSTRLTFWLVTCQTRLA